jgi:hypothetical protein
MYAHLPLGGCFFFALGAEEDWEIHQVDVKTAFLNGSLEEDVYMRQPPGFHFGKPGGVCKLVRSLYGLRQAPRQWHAELCRVFNEVGFTPCEGDPGLFKREGDGHAPVFVEVYVDDMLIGSKDLKMVEDTVVEGSFQHPRPGAGQVFSWDSG